MAVCSDITVSDDGDQDESVHDLGLPSVTTDPAEIAAFLGVAKNDRKQIIFATYQSSPRITEATKLLPKGFSFDLIVFDEAHKTARVDGTLEDNAFVAALSDKKIPAKKRLFMTATPKAFSLSAKKKTTGDVYCMDDEAQYGTLLYEYPMRQAIEGKILVDFEPIGIAVTSEEVDNALGGAKSTSLSMRRVAALAGWSEATFRRWVTSRPEYAELLKMRSTEHAVVAARAVADGHDVSVVRAVNTCGYLASSLWLVSGDGEARICSSLTQAAAWVEANPSRTWRISNVAALSLGPP